MDKQDYEYQLDKMNKVIEDNSEKFHELFPHNPVLSKDDEWIDEKQWNDLFIDIENGGQ